MDPGSEGLWQRLQEKIIRFCLRVLCDLCGNPYEVMPATIESRPIGRECEGVADPR